MENDTKYTKVLYILDRLTLNLNLMKKPGLGEGLVKYMPLTIFHPPSDSVRLTTRQVD